MLSAFSPRTKDFSLYGAPNYKEAPELFDTLGKHSFSGSCLHIKSLEGIHLPTLKKIVAKGYKLMKKKHTS